MSVGVRVGEPDEPGERDELGSKGQPRTVRASSHPAKASLGSTEPGFLPTVIAAL